MSDSNWRLIKESKKEKMMRTQKLKSSKKDFPGGSKPQRACASTAGDKGLIPGRGTMIPHALWYGQKRFFLIKIK